VVFDTFISDKRAARESISESSPDPKKWTPGPHFCKILSVST